jgi:hypothetical protein
MEQLIVQAYLLILAGLHGWTGWLLLVGVWGNAMGG